MKEKQSQVLRKFYCIGKHEQLIEIVKGRISKITCTCMHGSLYPKNWFEGEKICKHLVKLISREVCKKNGIQKRASG